MIGVAFLDISVKQDEFIVCRSKTNSPGFFQFYILPYKFPGQKIKGRKTNLKIFIITNLQNQKIFIGHYQGIPDDSRKVF